MKYFPFIFVYALGLMSGLFLNDARKAYKDDDES